mmetsp:Transcript_16436/g.29865  ORF Transcript_16436/g.29865 Transcript_16436/m.29865 type:complete len:352 (+) Transcript_16436:149-1204(+)
MTGLLTSPEVEVATPGKRTDVKSKGGGGSKASTKANINNLLNILGYFLSLVTSYLGGVAGWFGGVSNSELSSKYQTLITPNASYFQYIWAIIFLFEGFFAIAQLLPKYREQPLVQRGVGSVYFLACASQTAWTITFGYGIMTAAVIAMFALLVALLAILKRQWTVVAEEKKKTLTSIRLGETTAEEIVEDLTAGPPRLSYWLLRFPFAVHAGWIAPATPLMLSVILVYQGVDPTYELWVAVISLPLLFGGCMGLLMREESGAPVYVFPGVVAYACIGICWELQAPAYAILSRHDEATVNLMKNLSGFCGACIPIVMVSRFIALFLRDQCIKWNQKEETLEIDGEEYPYVQA